MNVFEYATRAKLRFPSNKGDLTVEQVWDTPLTSKTGFDLDTVAKDVNNRLKAVTEESFVKTSRPTALQYQLELKLEVLKYIIGVKLAELDARDAKHTRDVERRRLQEALASKQDEALKALTPEEIQKRLAELGE